MALDLFLFKILNELPHIGLTDGCALFLEWMGDSEVIYTGVVCFFVFGLFQRRKRMWEGSLGVFLTAASTNFAVFVLQHIVRRARPYELLPEVYRVGKSGGFSSFPSEHAALVAAVFGFLMLYEWKGPMVCAFLILLAGLGRIYQGMHYPIDVLAGWAIGLFFAWVVVGALPLIDQRIRLLSIDPNERN